MLRDLDQNHVEYEELDGEDISDRNLFLCFRVGATRYGIEVMYLREVANLIEFHRMPGMPGYARGVMNLRGNLIPTIDARSRLGLTEAGCDRDSFVVILKFDGKLHGLVVDDVEEIHEIPDEQIEPMQNIYSMTDYASRVGRTRGGEILLVNVGKLLAG